LKADLLESRKSLSKKRTLLQQMKTTLNPDSSKIMDFKAIIELQTEIESRELGIKALEQLEQELF
jgi:hypothetical protein